MEQKGAFADFIVQHIRETGDEDDLSEIQQVLTETPNGNKIFQRAISVTSTGSQRRNSRVSERKLSITQQAQPIELPGEGTTLIKNEESATGRVCVNKIVVSITLIV